MSQFRHAKITNEYRKTPRGRTSTRRKCDCGAEIERWHIMGSTPKGVLPISYKTRCRRCGTIYDFPLFTRMLGRHAELISPNGKVLCIVSS